MTPGDQRRARPRLQVSVSDERGRALGTALARWLADVAPASARGMVSVAVVNDARVRALNRQYRGKDCATDVLSFPSAEGPAEAGPHDSFSRTGSGPHDSGSGAGSGLHDSGSRTGSGRHDSGRRIGAGPHDRLRGRERVRVPFSRGVRLQPDLHEQGHLGDIVIARGVARRQAKDAGHAERTELRVLALHGLLHLLGYDHEQDDGEMARLEKRLRRKGGLREGLIERA